MITVMNNVAIFSTKLAYSFIVRASSSAPVMTSKVILSILAIFNSDGRRVSVVSMQSLLEPMARWAVIGDSGKSDCRRALLSVAKSRALAAFTL